jgi:hypothetical protein
MNPNGPPKHIEGYLVELQNLKGLSGSPVFVRPTVDMEGLQDETGAGVIGLVTTAQVLLLGIWQGS